MFFTTGVAHADTIVANFTLSFPDTYPGTTWYSGNFELTFQSDGNLVLYRWTDWKVMWATGTWGYDGGKGPATRIDWSSSGWAQIYNKYGERICYLAHNNANGGPYAPGGRAMLQDDGNFVFYTTADQPNWSTGTYGGRVATNNYCGYSH
ncbi:hypothetical protein GCM10009838_51220 [Catenulispora subtropica]|uniref:Bulb-type lectin domain-containing protein n=2 Tax=Catenulispora subtropica TaxID=450798 RepID=A0ABN2SAH0_9ACTN